MRDTGSKTIAYYFHRTIRCPSCLAIEELSQQALREAFPRELANGSLVYRPVNVEAPGNEHFEEDYDLDVQSLVLVRVDSGQRTDWKNLEAVWDLFEDYDAFAQYVRREVSEFMYARASGFSPDRTTY